VSQEVDACRATAPVAAQGLVGAGSSGSRPRESAARGRAAASGSASRSSKCAARGWVELSEEEIVVGEIACLEDEVDAMRGKCTATSTEGELLLAAKKAQVPSKRERVVEVGVAGGAKKKAKSAPERKGCAKVPDAAGKRGKIAHARTVRGGDGASTGSCDDDYYSNAILESDAEAAPAPSNGRWTKRQEDYLLELVQKHGGELGRGRSCDEPFSKIVLGQVPSLA